MTLLNQRAGASKTFIEIHCFYRVRFQIEFLALDKHFHTVVDKDTEREHEE